MTIMPMYKECSMRSSVPGVATNRLKPCKLRIGFAAQYVDVVNQHVTIDLPDEFAPPACFRLMVKANHLQSWMARLEFLENHLLDLGSLLPWLGRHGFL